MSRSDLLSLPIAYGIGAVLAISAAALEWAISARPVPLEAAAAYALVGGGMAAATRWVLGRRRRAGGALAGTLVAMLPFVWLHLLYFVNVRLLPGEPYSSAESLALDALAIAASLAPLGLIARSSWARRARMQWEAESATLGAVLLASSLTVVALRWPVARPEPAGSSSGPNLLLIVLDSARRDHLGVYGYAPPTSPGLDTAAARARVYQKAFAASSWTVPSVDSLLDEPLQSPDAALQRRLSRLGYVTACFTDNPHLAPDAAIVRGFDHVQRSVPGWRSLFRHTVLSDAIERLDPGDDRRLVDRALEWAALARGPFFLYVHLMNSHTPYRFAPLDGRRRRAKSIEFPHSGMRVTAEEAESIVARYDGGLRAADREASRLLAAAPSWGRPFLAVVTADHGESLGESGRWFHDSPLSPELLAIPLLVLGDGVRPGRVAGAVGHAAIPATLLAAAGSMGTLAAEADLRTSPGESVVEGRLPPDLAYRVAGGFKLLVNRRTGQRQLFDVRADPVERHDCAAERRSLVDSLERGLEPIGAPADVSADLRERLRALGYAQ